MKCATTVAPPQNVTSNVGDVQLASGGTVLRFAKRAPKMDALDMFVASHISGKKMFVLIQICAAAMNMQLPALSTEGSLTSAN